MRSPLPFRARPAGFQVPARLLTFAAAGLLCWSTQSAEPDLIVADFESPDWAGCTATGSAFGTRPAAGALPGQMNVDGFLGRGLVNSFVGGDDAKGTLTSPTFKLQRRYLRFLIGGGNRPGIACLNLRVNDKIVRTATGPNDRPGGSEHLDWAEWNVADLANRDATLQIIDEATGGWGHINVDHILQTDSPLPGWLTNASRAITASRRYLHLPVKNGAPRRLMSLTVDGRLERQFEIELADGEPDWWAFLELDPFRGLQALLSVDTLREDSTGLGRIEQSDTLKGTAPLYGEALRPQFHFTSRRGWNNDPNGLVWHAGEYHLFYQHNPYGWGWGNMHWGHAVSRDLVHWRELGEALYPDAQGTMFSGSAVVDDANTTGWQRGSAKPLVCIYTAAGGTSPLSKGQPFTQGLAWSVDLGRTWTKFDGNPVLPHIAAENRDPKVFWHAHTHRWIMALYLNHSDFALFASPDLKRWEKLSDVQIPDTSECPEFFEIPIQGQRGQSRWIFYGGNGRYLVGHFDGTRFRSESGPHALNFGNCFYASQTFNNLPARDGRRILIPWGQVNLPGMPFNQMMGLPVALTLHQAAGGLRLQAEPIAELKKLRAQPVRKKPGPLKPGVNALAGVTGELFDLEAVIAVGQAKRIQFTLRGVPITYDVERQELTCLERKGPLPLVDGAVQLRVLVDRASVDVFGNAGSLYMPMGVPLKPEANTLELTAQGDGASIRKLEVFRMKSAWK